eukprot:TRINITY_DN15278_c0_g1_i2.p1 TRINITY_DN15278_c0_g1~~TRINITY_DN15278_c0_g1_i2.p1  ORF type:complete len:143 (-),score=32.92 TRINITY_DN15278_c0_g1_i2:259-687(-)
MGLSTLLLGVTTAMGYLDLVERAEKHTAARIAFASNQRSFATTLMISAPQDVAARFPEYSGQWNETLANAVHIKSYKLQAFRDEKNRKKPLLPLITPVIPDKKMIKARLAAEAEDVQRLVEKDVEEAVGKPTSAWAEGSKDQ